MVAQCRVTATVKLNDDFATSTDFNTPLIASCHTNFPELVRTYTSGDLDALVADGFTTDSATYRMAAAISSQSPRPREYKVGRLATPYTQAVTYEVVTPIVEGVDYTITVDGTDYTYTSQPADTTTIITAALALAVNNHPGISAVAADPAVDITADNPCELFAFSCSSPLMQFKEETPDPGITADLTAIEAQDDDWYALLTDSTSQPIIEAAAAWIESNGCKVYFAMSQDWDYKDSVAVSSVRTSLNAAGYNRTASIYHCDGEERADAAWASRGLGIAPGSVTFANLTLAGITPDVLSTTERNAIEGEFGNHYHRCRGQEYVIDGTMASGRYIDITRDSDATVDRLIVDLSNKLKASTKWPYTQAGVEVFRAAAANTLDTLVADGILAPDPVPSVDELDVTTLSADTINSRCVPLTIRGQLTGAIHCADLCIVLSLGGQ